LKILALDTATEACSVALGIGDRSIERYAELERGHAEQILPMVDAVLSEGGVALAQLDAIAFGRGPGGFTGVRLAAGAGRVLVVNDARMREVYWAWHSIDGDVQLVGEERVNAPSDIIIGPVSGTWVAAGRGLAAWPELAERCRAAGATLRAELLPRASEVLALARPRVACGQILAPDAALPVYVRDRVAEPISS
jgi:tRNA threonylcarbamoyladenosine biosynthesis protein TsaB